VVPLVELRLAHWLAARGDGCNLKFTALAQNLGRLYGSYRDFQSYFGVNLQILGPPCEFYLCLPGRQARAAAPGRAARSARRGLGEAEAVEGAEAQLQLVPAPA
jgi:hypothetical protein